MQTSVIVPRSPVDPVPTACTEEEPCRRWSVSGFLLVRNLSHLDEGRVVRPSAGFVDSRLSWHSAGFELYAAEIVQFRMLSARVLEAFDVVEYVSLGLVASEVDLALPCVWSPGRK